MGVPPSKPKYTALTDSELVPWGKGEIVPLEGSEKDTEILGLQAVEVYLSINSIIYKVSKGVNAGVPFA